MKGTAMDPHVHLGGVNIIASTLTVVAVIGSLHLLALTYPDKRISKAFIALGF